MGPWPSDGRPVAAGSRGQAVHGVEFDDDGDVVPAFGFADDFVADVGVDVLGKGLVTESQAEGIGGDYGQEFLVRRCSSTRLG